jgi:probable HAF family extracellular repeat protein
MRSSPSGRLQIRLPGLMHRAAASVAARAVLALSLAALPAVCAAETPRYTITDLGRMFPMAINAHGQIAGFINVPGTAFRHAALYDGREVRDLGTLGGSDSVAYDLNDAGEVVGESQIDSEGWRNAFLYRAGVMKSLGWWRAYGINNHGHAVGASLDAFSHHAILYRNGGIKDLGTLGGPKSVAFSINDAGQVAGISDGPSAQPRAFLYDRFGMRDLGGLSMPFPGQILNDSGQISYEAVLDTGFPPTDEGPRPWGNSINNMGNLVGTGELRYTMPGERAAPTGAFLYTGDQMVDLNTLLPAGSGWELQRAQSLNDRGQIAGVGKVNGETRGFLLTPTVDARTILPQAPGSLRAATVPPGLVRLTWLDHSDNETAFALWRRDAGGDWTKVATVLPNVKSFTDWNAGPAPTYRIRATNNTGASAWSNEAQATPQPAAPNDLRVTGVTTSRIDLAWTLNSDQRTALVVWRKRWQSVPLTLPGEWEQVAEIAPDRTEFSDLGLPANTLYEYRLRAINQTADSVWSPTAHGRTQAPLPPAVQGLSGNAVNATQIDLSWLPAGYPATGIGIWRKAGSGAWQPIAVVSPLVTRFSDRNALPEQTYVYRVRAHNNTGAAPWSNEATAITPRSLIGTPRGLTVSAVGRAGVQLTWSDTSGNETGFGIWRRTGSGPWIRIGVAAANATRFVDATVTVRITYIYRIRAHNPYGTSEWSNEVGAAVPPAP